MEASAELVSVFLRFNPELHVIIHPHCKGDPLYRLAYNLSQELSSVFLVLCLQRKKLVDYRTDNKENIPPDTQKDIDELLSLITELAVAMVESRTNVETLTRRVSFLLSRVGIHSAQLYHQNIAQKLTPEDVPSQC